MWEGLYQTLGWLLGYTDNYQSPFCSSVTLSSCHDSLVLFPQAYKNRLVLLRNSLALNCKTVEIMEGEEETEENRDVVRLSDVWSVQDKPSKNKGRYVFEVSKEVWGEGRGRRERDNLDHKLI